MRVIVIGAGVGGLTAARDLALAGHEVVVLEGSDRTGGKLRTAHVAGVRVDVGAEAMLARRPEGVALARALDLEVVHPTAATSRIWTRSALRPLPRTLMGVPMDLARLGSTGILSAEAMTRARQEPDLPAGPVSSALVAGADVSVGALVDERYGPEVTDQLVEPLLGGVYAGRAREISVRAAVPQLAAMATHGALGPQVAAIPPASDAPVFAGLRAGMGTLPERLVAAIEAAGGQVRTGVRVLAVHRSGPDAFEVHTDGGGRERADGVVLATPAPATAKLLETVLPERARPVAEALGRVPHASVGVVTFAFRAEDVPLDHTVSGFLVPPGEGRFIKAATFSFAKWAWVSEAGAGLVLLRTSVGRAGETATLDRTDAELVAASLADLRSAIGATGDPVDTHVQRWVDGLPQYAVGHLDLVDAVRAAVAEMPGLAVCGAAYDGVGIPAVVASAHRAADRLMHG